MTKATPTPELDPKLRLAQLTELQPRKEKTEQQLEKELRCKETPQTCTTRMPKAQSRHKESKRQKRSLQLQPKSVSLSNPKTSSFNSMESFVGAGP